MTVLISTNAYVFLKTSEGHEGAKKSLRCHNFNIMKYLCLQPLSVDLIYLPLCLSTTRILAVAHGRAMLNLCLLIQALQLLLGKMSMLSGKKKYETSFKCLSPCSVPVPGFLRDVSKGF